MKRLWELDELIEHFTLLPGEWDLLANKTGATRLGFAILLKYFEYEARFPESPGEIPKPVVGFLAKQLDLPAETFGEYDWQGRAIKYHRAQIREAFGFREATIADARTLGAWLCDEVLPHGQVYEQALAAAYGRCRACRLVPPTPARMERLVRSALRTFEGRFCAHLMAQLAPETRAQLDALLTTEDGDAQESHQDNPGAQELTREESHEDSSDAPGKGTWSLLADLKADPGRPGLATVLAEIVKLERLRALALPATVFHRLPTKLLQAYRQRVSAEPPRELRRHPAAVRYTLLAAFCWLRQQEITDQLVDLLIAIVHGIDARAERKIERQVLADVRQVTGKTTILFQLAEAALAHPDGIISAVLYPLVGEQTLRDLVREYKASGPAYRAQVQTTMRASYSHHYRQMVPHLLRLLELRSNNAVHRPVLRALALINAYAGRTEHYFAAGEVVPLDGVVRPGWRDLVVKTDAHGRERVNRIAYEICVLEALREHLRCKEVWVVGANRYRNPDEDLPIDFAERREAYYAALKLPTDAETFIDGLQAQMHAALTRFDDALHHTHYTHYTQGPQGRPQGPQEEPAVRLTTRHGQGWIALSALAPRPEPVNLAHLKGEVGRRWPMTTVLDFLKETDLRVGFTACFTSTASREMLEREVLQKRLLLCLHGLGTNTGLKRASVGTHGETYADLLYVRRRFIHKEHLRAAIAKVANAVFAIRHTTIWGEGTTACASDSKQFGAFDQNLMTQWHARYGGRGVMVYWHLRHEAVYVAVETGHARAQPGVLPLDPTRTCRRSNLAV